MEEYSAFVQRVLASAPGQRPSAMPESTTRGRAPDVNVARSAAAGSAGGRCLARLRVETRRKRRDAAVPASSSTRLTASGWDRPVITDEGRCSWSAPGRRARSSPTSRWSSASWWPVAQPDSANEMRWSGFARSSRWEPTWPKASGEVVDGGDQPGGRRLAVANQVGGAPGQCRRVADDEVEAVRGHGWRSRRSPGPRERGEAHRGLGVVDRVEEPRPTRSRAGGRPARLARRVRGRRSPRRRRPAGGRAGPMRRVPGQPVPSCGAGREATRC